jgi:sucrose-6F-phosphate phosphohydrolase
VERVNLLVCDLDGTLLGDDRALGRFADWYAGARDRFRLVYSSGRFVDSIRESIDATALPQPDALIGGVGTEIYVAALRTRISMWPPSILGWNPHIVRAICESHRELTPQPEQFLSYHKMSFFGRDLDPSFVAGLVDELAAVGQSVTVVYSSHRDLDVLPADAHKGAAAAFLARTWKIHPQRVFVAGDSGNDATMFLMGFRGIVVGNAQSELRSLAAAHVYHATAEFADGVLEGLGHWLNDPAVAARADQLTAAPTANRDTPG